MVIHRIGEPTDLDDELDAMVERPGPVPGRDHVAVRHPVVDAVRSTEPIGIDAVDHFANVAAPPLPSRPMPEGHTIHRIALDHSKLLKGKHVEVSSPQGRFADALLIDGHRLDAVTAHGKHLWYEWSNGMLGHVHLGLFGKFRVTRHDPGAAPDPIGMVRMRLAADDVTIDLAGPTDCSVGDESDRDAILRRLGPDPLRRDAEPRPAFDRIMKSRQPIGALLLDQSVICGVGNVYRAEALFVNGIHPSRAGRDMDPVELQALWATTVSMLRQGVKDNRIVTVDRGELDLPRGRRIRRGEATYAYKRDRCLRCSTPISSIELGGRPCYFCPTCQPV